MISWYEIDEVDAPQASVLQGEFTLASVSSRQTLACLYPDFPLEAALGYVNQVRLVPVVNRADSRDLEGVVSIEAVLKK